MDGELTELLEETAIVVTHGGFATHSWRMSSEKDNKEDINHNQTSVLIFEPSLGRGQSNIQEADERDGLSSPQPSPLSKHKPFIPPLDLSILHEHVDGSGKNSLNFKKVYIFWVTFLCISFLWISHI